MKIHIAVVGLARSLEFCYPSIERNIAGLMRLDPSIEISQSVTVSYSTHPLNNERTGEFQAATPDPEFVRSIDAKILPVETLREECASLFDFTLQAGEWLSGSGRNLRNYLEFLTLLRKSAGTEQTNSAEIVIFVRPDVFVLDRLFPVRGVTISKKAILTPRWGRFHGLNDRIAILPQKYVPQYFSRIETVRQFVTEIGPFDPEKHLAWTVRELPSRPTLGTELIRIRAGGVLSEKDMERLESSGPFRLAQARRLRRRFPSR